VRVDVLSKEYPPEIYGGAGVHVAELVRALRPHLDVVVRCFGAPRDEPGVHSYPVPDDLTGTNPALVALGTDLRMAKDVIGADLVHSHTWYANGAGHLAQLMHDIPHVVTAHSLEPLRPWKAGQLGGGYRVSSWLEKGAFTSANAVIAVSESMRRDVLRCYPTIDENRVHVVHNGIDLEHWKPQTDEALLRTLGIDPSRPTVVFVGRITRQKGLRYLLRAAGQLPPDVQLVLCAGAPDTEEILTEVRERVSALKATRTGVVWINRLLDVHELRVVLSAATAFVCPSIYEPLGIVNLEAMACATAVDGTAVGGIPEVVEDGVTGRLVPLEQLNDGTGTPTRPTEFVAELARTLTEVVSDPVRAKAMGAAGRRRAQQEFGWDRIAARTREIYAAVLA
jgi:starch synthase